MRALFFIYLTNEFKNIMKNLINEIKSISEKEITSFGITEVFVVNNELYTTSLYDIPNEMIEKLENELSI